MSQSANFARSYRCQNLRADKLEDAIAKFREAVRLAPTIFIHHEDLAVALRDHGDVAEAIEELRDTMHLAPTLAQPYIELSDLLLQQGRLNDTLENYKTAIKNVPDNSSLHGKLALVLQRMADRENGDQKFALLREACAELISASKLSFADADLASLTAARNRFIAELKRSMCYVMDYLV